MRNKKLLLTLVLALVLTFALTGCGNDAKDDEDVAEGAWEFERPIEFVIPWGPGSGTDTTMRAWAPLMEKEMGVKFTINNVEGAGGVKGGEFYQAQPADGYTFAYNTQSHLIAAIDGTTNYDVMEETIPVARLVQDTNMILAGKHTPYNSATELVEYAKANPDKKPTVAMMSIKGIDGAAATELFDAMGIEVNFIPYSSGAEAEAGVMGGHTDMILASPADAGSYLESGDMKGIVVLAEERSSALPDVECTGELGYDAYIGPWRSVVAKKGTPEGAIKAIQEAAAKVNEMQEWKDWKESMGLNDRPAFAVGEDFQKIWNEDYENLKELRELIK